MHITDDILEKAQKLQLMCLCEFDRVCRESNLRYFLSDGTLIGAIRHNGFIPWDDDIDVGMLREDYEKFKRIADGALSPSFKFVCAENCDKFPFILGRIYLKNTIWQEEWSKGIDGVEKGFSIDIQPYDYCPRGKLKQFLHYHWVTLFGGARVCKDGYRFEYEACLKPLLAKILAAVFPRQFLSLMLELGLRAPSGKSQIYTKFGGNYWRNRQPKANYEVVTTHIFDGHDFMIPAAYDRILTDLYGDYMTPPPEAERVVHHPIVECDFGEYA